MYMINAMINAPHIAVAGPGVLLYFLSYRLPEGA